MKNKKPIIPMVISLFILVSIFSLSACGNNSNTDDPKYNEPTYNVYQILDYSTNTGGNIVPKSENGYTTTIDKKVVKASHTNQHYIQIDGQYVLVDSDDRYYKCTNISDPGEIVYSEVANSEIYDYKVNNNYYKYVEYYSYYKYYNDESDFVYTPYAVSNTYVGSSYSYTVDGKTYKYVTSNYKKYYNSETDYVYSTSCSEGLYVKIENAFYQRSSYFDFYGFYDGQYYQLEANGYFYVKDNVVIQCLYSQFYTPKEFQLNSDIQIESKVLFGNYKVLGFGEAEPVYKVKFPNDANYYLVVGLNA